MPKIETYKKQANCSFPGTVKGNCSIGGRIRQLARYRTLSDREALALKFPLTEAQEIIALEAGCASWAELKASTEATPPTSEQPETQDTAVARLTKQAWGGTDFIVRDPDGNAIAFVG